MVTFDEEKQERQIKELRQREEEDLVQIMAETKFNLPYINLTAAPLETEALRVVPEEKARRLGVAPFKITGKKVHIAILSPRKEGFSEFKEDLARRGFSPTFYMASHASIERVWERYEEISLAEAAKAGGLSVSGKIIKEIGEQIKQIRDVKGVIDSWAEKEKSHRITRILEVILAGAVSLKVSDLHIEPEQDKVRLRYRLDGVLQDVLDFDFHDFKLINARIKLLSGMKLTITEDAQDGRFSIFIGVYEVNVRSSTMPGEYGESIVMRILDPRAIQVELEDLGIEPKLLKIFEREIRKPNGLILETGPTGSGKTTTLYTFLRKIYSPEIKIITIEDPVEYHLEGIIQTQVEHEKGYDFLSGLRAAMRQDPDVIMVGEIRDPETARIAVQASLTGHIVFSTLHTNNAAGAIPRLLDLGVEPKILPSALSMAIAQRLVRRLCSECKKKKSPSKEDEKLIRDILKEAEREGIDLSFYNVSVDMEISLWEATGCPKCNNTGYKGRIGVFEAVLSDESIENIITKNPSDREIKKAAEPQKILEMKQDGVINKVLTGITSLEELGRVVDLYEK